jgi:hypothetical protein
MMLVKGAVTKQDMLVVDLLRGPEIEVLSIERFGNTVRALLNYRGSSKYASWQVSDNWTPGQYAMSVREELVKQIREALAKPT